MSAELFLDTNLLIYWLNEGVPEKQQKAWRPVAESLNSSSSCISYQVVQEAVNMLICVEGGRRVFPDLSILKTSIGNTKSDTWE
jgi:predicted nucleic acid-binding protein